jgi:hypothetical protein
MSDLTFVLRNISSLYKSGQPFLLRFSKKKKGISFLNKEKKKKRMRKTLKKQADKGALAIRNLSFVKKKLGVWRCSRALA